MPIIEIKAHSLNLYLGCIPTILTSAPGESLPLPCIFKMSFLFNSENDDRSFCRFGFKNHILKTITLKHIPSACFAKFVSMVDTQSPTQFIAERVQTQPKISRATDIYDLSKTITQLLHVFNKPSCN